MIEENICSDEDVYQFSSSPKAKVKVKGKKGTTFGYLKNLNICTCNVHVLFEDFYQSLS